MGMLESTSALLSRTQGGDMPYPVDPEVQAYSEAKDAALSKVLKHEGGYQNNKSDAANKNSKGQWVGTNKGITPQAYEEYTGEVPTQRDMMKLSKDKASAIYTANYVRPIVDNLGIKPTSPLFEQVLDMAVNHGYSGAVAIIQRAAGTEVDGKAGPATAQAIAALPPEELNNRMVDARQAEYARINKAKPETATFSKGWNKRAESFRRDNGESKPESAPVAGESPEPAGAVQGYSSRPQMR